MYTAADPTSALEQGDVCRDIPLPVIGDDIRLFDSKTKEWFKSTVPDDDVLNSRSHVAAMVQMVRCPVVVLSQSCDLEEAERDPQARLLVAPALADDDGRFAERYADAVKSASDGFVKNVAAMLTNPTQAEKSMAKTKGQLESTRQKHLDDLWLGKVEGAFPLAADPGCALRRSVCFFDSAVSLPSAWIPLLKKQRVLRLKPEWGHVLREKLSTWLGRFAFPGSKKERLAAGGFGVEPPSVTETPEED